MFNNSIKWTAPNSVYEKVYLTAIKTENYTTVTLTDSGDSGFASGTSFYGVSEDVATYGNKIYFKLEHYFFTTIFSLFCWYNAISSKLTCNYYTKYVFIIYFETIFGIIKNDSNNTDSVNLTTFV